MSFAGSTDLRVKQDEVCAALDVKPEDICLCMVVSKRKVTPKDYLDVCCDPKAHGDFNSEIHKRSRKLHSQFMTLGLIDYSRAPDNSDKRSQASKRKSSDF